MTNGMSMVSDVYIEQRRIGAGVALSWDIAHHLYARLLVGKAAVVTDGPHGLRNAVSKQWLHILRQLHVQRASTLDANRIWELTQYVKRLEAMSLSVRDQDADVLFLSMSQALATPPSRPTLYVTKVVTNGELRKLAASVPRNGVVVLYS